MSAQLKTSEARKAPLLALVAAFAAIYVIWGSTYLAIRFAIETLPPFLMAGTRFLTAGIILLLVMRARGAAMPSLNQWRNAAIVGILLLMGGNGLVCWAQQSVASSIAALVIGTMPLWMTMLHWLIFKGPRPGTMLIAGIAVGFGGVALLTWSEGFRGEGSSPWAIAALLVACLSWSIGSLRSRSSDQGNNMFTASAMQMIAGGAAMLLLGSLAGEWPRVDLAAVSLKSVLAYAYLVIFGSLIAFSAYVWLLSVVSPTAVSTYAYVNPIVAVLLGWWLAGETLSSLTLIAGALIVSAVVLMTLRRSPRQAPPNDAKTQATTEPQHEPPVTVALPPSAAIRK